MALFEFDRLSTTFYWSAIVSIFYRNVAMPFGTEKLKWSRYTTEKKFEDMCNRFDRIPACDRQTDRRTDGRTSCNGNVRDMHSIVR